MNAACVVLVGVLAVQIVPPTWPTHLSRITVPDAVVRIEPPPSWPVSTSSGGSGFPAWIHAAPVTPPAPVLYVSV